MADETPSTPSEKVASAQPLPMPSADQTWVHSCCSKAKLQTALIDPAITAIEADIMMPAEGAGSSVPIMAHPPAWGSKKPPASDLDFETFLQQCVSKGNRHLKLDFKDSDSLEPCLQLLAKRWPELQRNGQAVWLNADVLPGPNARGKVALPPKLFLPLCRRYCPHAFLSLGWRVGPIGPEEAYTAADVLAMAELCREYALPGASVVFAASLRMSERALTEVVSILTHVPESQLLFWTGFGEAPVRRELHVRALEACSSLGVSSRVGYDISVVQSVLGGATSDAIDCTFFWSRWARYLFCGQICCGPNGMGSSGERQSLLGANGGSFSCPPTPSSTPRATPDEKCIAKPDGAHTASNVIARH